MYKKCARLLGCVFNATYAVYLVLIHKCLPPGGEHPTHTYPVSLLIMLCSHIRNCAVWP